jgi:phenylacetate-CoA ligase
MRNIISQHLGKWPAAMQMKHNQWKSRTELEGIQEQKLRNLLEYAKNNVPYYRKTLAGSMVKDLEDLRNLPILSRSDVQAAGDSLISGKFEKTKLLAYTTTGSSGLPISPYYSLLEGHFGAALAFHQQTEAGFGPLDYLAYLRYEHIPDRYCPRFFYRMKTLPLYLGEAEALARVKAMGANILRTYASVLTLLAAANQDVGLSFKRVFSTSEYLSPRARKLIESSFSTRIHNFYGANEVSWIAWQCEEGGMHLHSDSTILEVVDSSGQPAKEGDILITSLWRYSMPFIRYRVGDSGSLGTGCKCGRGTHVIKSLKGKNNDFFILPSGRPWSPMFLEIVLFPIKGIVLYQATQDRPGKLLLSIVASRALDRVEIAKKLQACLPEPVDIEIDFPESLPKGRTGKIKSFISRARPKDL